MSGRPRTAAGRRLEKWFDDHPYVFYEDDIGAMLSGEPTSSRVIRAAIRAIEAESTAAVLLDDPAPAQSEGRLDVERLRSEIRANRVQGVRWEPAVEPKVERWYAEGYDRGLRDAEAIIAAYFEAAASEEEA